ncbi:MAG: phosphoribosylformylglycinamidine cyclo-ligase [Acidimicrobiia bacterium]|nr:phosphoribosylformylglycinamidine cyclo-ligase [Acidimicrobiia bacterium]
MSTYSGAGVDVAAADRFTNSIASRVTATWTEHVVGTFGGFATGITIPDGYTRPVLMMTTDGVGTKAELARRLGQFDGIGHDLVAMCVDDLAAQRATPLGFTDYLAVGALQPERDEAIIGSIADACRLAGCALLGGETAVHPGVMEPEQFDLAGAALGVAEAAELFDPGDVRPGDAIIGVASPNVRSNGFSLVRSVFTESDLRDSFEGTTLGDVVLEPSVIYAPTVLEAARELPIRAMAHITGGGLPGNLPRVLPEGLTAHLDVASWEIPAIFGIIAERGGIEHAEMFQTFNMGIGFALVVPAAHAESTLAAVTDHPAWIIGEVVPGNTVRLQP